MSYDWRRNTRIGSITFQMPFVIDINVSKINRSLFFRSTPYTDVELNQLYEYIKQFMDIYLLFTV